MLTKELEMQIIISGLYKCKLYLSERIKNFRDSFSFEFNLSNISQIVKFTVISDEEKGCKYSLEAKFILHEL